MSNIDTIRQLEARLRDAELGPDPEFFRQVLADDAVLDGEFAKAKIIEAHRPGQGPKFTRVEMSDFKFVDHGAAVVVTCKGEYEGPRGAFTLRFMRVWLRQADGWQIVAGTVANESQGSTAAAGVPRS